MSSEDVEELSPPVRPPRGRRLAVTAVLGVLVAGGIDAGAWAADRPAGPASGGTAPAVVCPATLDHPGSTTPADAVPGAPTASGTSGRLVPDRIPSAVVVCEYDLVAPAGPAGVVGPPTASGPRAVGRSAAHSGTDPAVAPLVGALRTVTANGHGSAEGCASPAGPAPAQSSQPLVGLRYDDGMVWVTTVGGCGVEITNGVATHPFDLAGPVDGVLSTDPGPGPGATTVAPVPPSGSGVSTGAPGVPDPSTASSPPNMPAPPGTGGPTVLPGPDDPFVSCAATGPPASDVLVPFTPVAVRVCHVGVDPAGTSPTAVDRAADVATRLAAALASLPTLEPDVVCTAIGGEQWALLFTAADGTSAAVQVDAGGCGSATNGVRTAKADAALYAALTAAG